MSVRVIGDFLCSGRDWSNGNVRDPCIKNTLQLVMVWHKVPDVDDLLVRVGRQTAIQMARSEEVFGYRQLAHLQLDRVKGKAPKNAIWGIPDEIYGIAFEVSDGIPEGIASILLGGNEILTIDGVVPAS